MIDAHALDLLYHHPLVFCCFRWDAERYRCARYLLHLQTQRQAELSKAEMLAAIDLCHAHPGKVGEELALWMIR